MVTNGNLMPGTKLTKAIEAQPARCGGIGLPNTQLNQRQGRRRALNQEYGPVNYETEAGRMSRLQELEGVSSFRSL